MQIPYAREQIALNRAPPNQRVSLEQLAQQSAVVYLDNSLLHRSYNLAEIRKSVQKDDFRLPDFATRIGACVRFSGLNIRLLRREAAHASAMALLMKRYASLRSVSEVASEHLQFQEHISRSLSYLLKNSVSRTGMKERLLRQVVEHYQEVQALLEERSLADPAADEVSRFLCEKELYKPRGNAFRKRFGEAVASMADAGLVSHALFTMAARQNNLCQKEVAIATADADIINLLDNYCFLQRNGELPPSFPYAGKGIRIYFPDDTFWFPELKLNQSYRT